MANRRSRETKQYVGGQACAPCHAEKFASQIKTSIGRAAARVVDSEQIKSHPDLNAKFGTCAYECSTKDGQSKLSVNGGAQSTSKDLLSAVGDGRFGQTYLYRHKAGFGVLVAISRRPRRTASSIRTRRWRELDARRAMGRAWNTSFCIPHSEMMLEVAIN